MVYVLTTGAQLSHKLQPLPQVLPHDTTMKVLYHYKLLPLPIWILHVHEPLKIIVSTGRPSPPVLLCCHRSHALLHKESQRVLEKKMLGFTKETPHLGNSKSVPHDKLHRYHNSRCQKTAPALQWHWKIPRKEYPEILQLVNCRHVQIRPNPRPL